MADDTPMDPMQAARAARAFPMRLEVGQWEVYLIESLGGSADGQRRVLIEFQGSVMLAGGQHGHMVITMPPADIRLFIDGLLTMMDERQW